MFFLGFNTGLIPLAISHSKPIVFPDIGNFTEQVNGWNYYQKYEVGNKEFSN